MRRYRKVRRKSARRERDGPVIDLLPNIASGMPAGSAKLAPEPIDLLRATWPPTMRRMARRTVRAGARAFD